MIDINKFKVFNTEQKQIPVMLPSTKGAAFRVSLEEVIENVSLTYNKNRKIWYLINPKLAQEHGIFPTYVSDIYHAVTDKDQEFLIPVTKGWNGENTDYSSSLMAMIVAAEKSWVRRTGVEDDIHQYKVVHLNRKPKFHHTMDECLESAFQNRIFEKSSDLKNKITEIEEEFD